jgi:hypothetical protein
MALTFKPFYFHRLPLQFSGISLTPCFHFLLISVPVSPMIWVPNQLVGAPAGTNVTIDCHTEAYPRAISYWVYENVMILATKKYGTDTAANSYRAHMKLTIRDLRDKDFGNYRCISKNSLGETEGSIRLYGSYPQ